MPSSSPYLRILSGLTDGQILQRLGARGGAAEIAGETSASGPLLASIFAGKTRKALRGWTGKKVGAAARGKFTAKLAGIPVGGPYRLELTCGDVTTTISEFLVGDLWVLAGQSNMEGVGNRDGAAKPHPLIRSLSMKREWGVATEPLHVLRDSPDPCHYGEWQFTPKESAEFRRTSRKGVGVGLFFGRDMLKRSGVPQGLICVAHGGTSMQQWSPALKDQGGKSLYGSMFLSLRAVGQPVAGVLWYQGESDANPTDALLYTERMKALVAAVRKDLRQPKLPWIVVQIARVNGIRNSADIPAWNSVQEQERLLPGKIPALETVAAIDLEIDDGIHISATGYPRLAARMARAAARLVLGDRKEQRPPQLRGITTSPDLDNNGGWWIDVHFDHVVGGLRAPGKPNGFAVIDGQGNDLNAIFKTTLCGSTVRLHANLQLIEDMRVHHGFACFPYCNITDARDEALPVFGPFILNKPRAVLPYITSWHATDVVSNPPPLGEIAVPEGDVDTAPILTGPVDGFINQHSNWMGKSGQAYLAAKMTLPEPMKLDFRISYDGPFRLWVNRKVFFEDLKGANPCNPDKAKKAASLPAGEYDLRVAMDINRGNAWGFRLRFERKDLKQAQIDSGDYTKPVYST